MSCKLRIICSIIRSENSFFKRIKLLHFDKNDYEATSFFRTVFTAHTLGSDLITANRLLALV